jgi:hypothetical protein
MWTERREKGKHFFFPANNKRNATQANRAPSCTMQRLDQGVADLVRSSQTIASMAQAVEELVLNSTPNAQSRYDLLL